ncbi:MAG: adenylate kinase [Haloarculaceae archaeon]
MDVTVVSGVPGVGSSRVCQEARSRLGEGYTLLNFGDVMLERAVAGDREFVADRDDLATLPRREIRLLQRRAAEFVATTARGESVILNTHLAVATAHGFLTGMPDAVLADIDPARFVLVEADPETVADRRESVDYREYREQGPWAIDFHQDLNRAAAMAHSVATGAPVRLVENTEAVEDAAADLVAIVSEADPSA